MLGKWGITLIFLFLPLEMVYSFSGLVSDHLGQTHPDGGLCLRTFYITYLSYKQGHFWGMENTHLWRLWRRVLWAVPSVLLQFLAVGVLLDTTPVAFESFFLAGLLGLCLHSVRRQACCSLHRLSLIPQGSDFLLGLPQPLHPPLVSCPLSIPPTLHCSP